MWKSLISMVRVINSSFLINFFFNIARHLIVVLFFIMKKVFFIISLAFVLLSCNDNSDALIRSAVDNQMKNYPKSTLQDLYKCFFQDYFGPGHIVSDSIAAKEYLLYELENMQDDVAVLLYESTGYKHNYVRVSLDVIRDSIVPFNAYLSAFLRSVKDIEGLSHDEWCKEWKKIVGVIDDMNLNLPNYQSDKCSIDSLLDAGKYVMHHSKSYGVAYHPHYRIMRRDIFDKEILPYIKEYYITPSLDE